MATRTFPRLFCGDINEVFDLQRMATRISISPGKGIFEEEDRADFIFGVSEGVVRLFKMKPDGGRQIVSWALPGEFLEMPSIEKYMLSANAVDTVLLYRFPRKPLEACLLSNANLMRLLLEFATRQLKVAQQQLLMLGQGSAEERIVSFLTTWHSRSATLGHVSDYLPLPMKREDIADFLALKIETVSRTFTRLEKRKIIRIVPRGVVLAASLMQ